MEIGTAKSDRNKSTKINYKMNNSADRVVVTAEVPVVKEE
jgi:hypothetical protein